MDFNPDTIDVPPTLAEQGITNAPGCLCGDRLCAACGSTPVSPTFRVQYGPASAGWPVLGWVRTDESLGLIDQGYFDSRSDAQADWAKTHLEINVRSALDAVDLMLEGPMVLPPVPGVSYQPRTEPGRAMLAWMVADAEYEAALADALAACEAIGATVETVVSEVEVSYPQGLYDYGQRASAGVGVN